MLGPPAAGFWLAGLPGLLAGVLLVGLFFGSLDESFWRPLAPAGLVALLVMFVLGGGLPSLRLNRKHWRSLIRDAGVLLYVAAVVSAWL